MNQRISFHPLFPVAACCGYSKGTANIVEELVMRDMLVVYKPRRNLTLLPWGSENHMDIIEEEHSYGFGTFRAYASTITKSFAEEPADTGTCSGFGAACSH
jgi:hypothetical protein